MVVAYPANLRGPLADPDSSRLHKEGREGAPSHFSPQQQFKLNFLNDLLTKSAGEEEGGSWMGSVGTHRVTLRRRRRRWRWSIYSAGRIGVNRMPSFLFIRDKVEIAARIEQRRVFGQSWGDISGSGAGL